MKEKGVFQCIIVFWLLLAPVCVFAQEKSGDIKNKTVSIKMEKQPLGNVFGYLMKNYDLAIGFEESTLDRDNSEYLFDTNLPQNNIMLVSPDNKSKITLEVKQVFRADKHPISVDLVKVKLEDALNQIVGQMENYSWEINNEVINIFPVKGRDQRFKKLLEIKVSKFTFEKINTVNEILPKLRELIELNKFTREFRFNLIGHRTGVVELPDDRFTRTTGFGMDYSNVTFRELLNKITKTKKGGWILRWGGISNNPRAEFFIIDI